MDIKSLHELVNLLGSENVVTTPDSVTAMPQTAEQVQQLLRWAAAHDMPVYLYRTAPANGLALSLQKMNRIVEVDTANLVATVEPGTVLADLAAALAKEHLRFIPADTPFYRRKTLGRLIYEGCANISGWKYGFAKHFLMGMDMVLPTGELLHTGGKTVKNVTGYDLTRFLNGPYADLGVPVKFLLKLLPLPETRKSAAIRFAGISQVFSFAAALRQAHVIPSYVIWVDRRTQAMLRSPAPVSELVYLELDGFAEEVDEQWPVVEQIIAQQGGKLAGEDSQQLAVAALEELYNASRGFALTDELKFPFAVQQSFVEQFYALTEKKKVAAGLFGQIGEGKLHLYVETLAAPQHTLIKAALDLARQAGGCVAGKYQRLYGDGGSGPLYELEKRLKRAVDPQNVLNR